MAVTQEGSNIVVSSSVAGSVFPTSDRELVFPVLVDGTHDTVQIEGALYGRTVELRGNVKICGPIVVRGDTKLDPRSGQILLRSGITVNGTLNCIADQSTKRKSIRDTVQNAGVIIKGDISVNQNISLKNAIVFGSVRAANCSLEDSLVLGTCIIDETLKVSMSSIGGYASRDVTFEGDCLMLHALGESYTQPLFVPYERPSGEIVGCDIRYYPAVRGATSMTNCFQSNNVARDESSMLFPGIDWVSIEATANPALEEQREGAIKKWVLSIGGRIGDISKIHQTMTSLAQMLKCGFEFEHYHLAKRGVYLKKALVGLTEEERWILQTVCA